MVAGGEVAGEDAFGEGVFDAALDGAAQGAGTKGGVVAFFDKRGACAVGDGEVDVTLGEASAHFVEQDVGDHGEFGLGERLEDDHFVDAVEELRAEGLLQRVLDVAVAGVTFGLGAGGLAPKALARLARFGMVTIGSSALAVRTVVPPLPRRWVEQLPDYLRDEPALAA